MHKDFSSLSLDGEHREWGRMERLHAYNNRGRKDITFDWFFSFSKYLLNIYYEPCRVKGVEDTEIEKDRYKPSDLLVKFLSLLGGWRGRYKISKQAR